MEQVLAALLKTSRPRALESANYTLRYNGVSLSGLTHFTRHRIHSIEIPELIYTDRKKHIIPPAVQENPALLEKYNAAFERMAAEYEAWKLQKDIFRQVSTV